MNGGDESSEMGQSTSCSAMRGGDLREGRHPSRKVLALGEAVLGIVYETDARIEPRVKIVGAFPPDLPVDRRLLPLQMRRLPRRKLP